MPQIKRLAVVALLTALAAAPVRAQDPSADAIIRSLRPGSGLLGTSRGIRPVKPVAPAATSPSTSPNTPASTPASAPVAHVTAPRAAVTAPVQSDASSEAPSVNLSVQFATNSAELTPAAVRTLTQLGRALSSSTLSAYRFRIEGHTDTAGSSDLNKTLSERRAHAVVDFLASTFKIDPSRLEPVGMGEDGLLIQTPANTPEARNRRVQVINLGA